MEIFLSIVFLVFGILQIILVFKVWGMTNDVKVITGDVKRIKSHISEELDPLQEAMVFLLQGKDVEAVEIIKKEYYKECLDAYHKASSEDYLIESAWKKAYLSIKSKYSKYLNPDEIDFDAFDDYEKVKSLVTRERKK